MAKGAGRFGSLGPAVGRHPHRPSVYSRGSLEALALCWATWKRSTEAGLIPLPRCVKGLQHATCQAEPVTPRTEC